MLSSLLKVWSHDGPETRDPHSILRPGMEVRGTGPGKFSGSAPGFWKSYLLHEWKAPHLVVSSGHQTHGGSISTYFLCPLSSQLEEKPRSDPGSLNIPYPQGELSSGLKETTN